MPDASGSGKRLFLVEDDQSLGFLLYDNLKSAGYLVDLFDDGLKAYTAFRNRQYDIGVLDIMLPGQSGIELAQKIRKSDSEIPLIFLSAKDQVHHRIEGLEAGANDYITKPFSIRELILRLEVHLRSQPKKSTEDDFAIGRFVLKRTAPQLISSGNIQSLSPKEYAILVLLASEKNKLVKKQVLMEKVWKDSSFFIGRSLDVYISKLRKHLSADENISLINYHGQGYMLKDE